MLSHLISRRMLRLDPYLRIALPPSRLHRPSFNLDFSPTRTHPIVLVHIPLWWMQPTVLHHVQKELGLEHYD
jgi:hypothetical protein